MIAGLRKRFIAIATLSIMLVLGVLMLTVDLASFGSIEDEADRTLDSLIVSNVFSNGMPLPSSSTDGEEPTYEEDPVDEGSSAKSSFFRAAIQAGGKSSTKDYESHYFSVGISADGNYQVFMANETELTSAQAIQLAKLAASGSKSKGYVSTYRYVLVSRGDGLQCYFLDCTDTMQSGVAFCIVTTIVFLAGVLVFFLLVCLLSRSVFYPVEESYKKQKSFITNAGHELKTPLAIIDSCTEVIEMENGETKWTEGIHTQVERLSIMTQELITMAKFEENDQDLERAVFNLSEAFNDVIKPFALMAEEQGFLLHTMVTDNVLIYGNERSLRQVISILADNAIKYAKPGTTIILGVANQRHKVQIFSKNDTLDPITPGQHRELFDRFYRGDTSHSNEKKGYGIGLSMAQTVTRAHGGAITAQSDDGTALLIIAQLPDGLNGREASKQAAEWRKAHPVASDISFTDVEDVPEEPAEDAAKDIANHTADNAQADASKESL